MKLSNETIAILRNFATINPSILITEGSELKSISIQRNIISKATIKETFEHEFGIYDLSEFLSVLNLFNNPEIEFEDDHLLLSSGSTKCKYNFCEKATIIYPKKDITFPAVDVQFDLLKEDLERILKATTNLSLPDILIHNEDNDLFISVIDAKLKEKDSNMFSIKVGTCDHESPFKLYILSENMKMVKDNYTVKLSKAGISEFVGSIATYNITLEKNSKMG